MGESGRGRFSPAPGVLRIFLRPRPPRCWTGGVAESQAGVTLGGPPRLGGLSIPNARMRQSSPSDGRNKSYSTILMARDKTLLTVKEY